MIRRVVCGFQTGADIGGARAAKACGIEPGGWMPAGFKTEEGPRPEYAELYGAKEHASDEYPARTFANVMEADVTIWFGDGDTAGYLCTRKACEVGKKEFWEIGTKDARPTTPRELAVRLRLGGIESINVAGNRESNAPGIAAKVEAYLTRVFQIMGAD